ncbi:MAG: hypothetical protein OXI24_19235 [Candidatus Poribacteria bacterium]|nr:hypothetical protein [Candidatus Poribacteria bacterium]
MGFMIEAEKRPDNRFELVFRIEEYCFAISKPVKTQREINLALALTRKLFEPCDNESALNIAFAMNDKL